MVGIYKFDCIFKHRGCSARFRSQAGRTYHVRSQHSNNNLHIIQQGPPSTSSQPSCQVQAERPFTEPAIEHNEVEPSTHNVQSDQRPENQSGTTSATRERIYHPHLTGRPCDIAGHPIDANSKPEPRSKKAPDDWFPFDSQGHFRLGTWIYHKTEVSAGEIDELMDIWASGFSLDNDDFLSPFDSHKHLYDTIDSIDQGNAPWNSFNVSYAGQIGPNAPSWQTKEYTVCYRDPRLVIANMFDNPDFQGQFEYAPYVELNQSGERCWNEFMSGNLSWRHATTIYEDDPSTEGATYCPIILGADKTTVSVATGHVEYHPLYMSIGNMHNTVRRGHRQGVIPIAFLAIPKTDRQHDNDPAFRKFKRQLYHASLTAILKPLRRGMTHPIVLRCPDGHYRRVIFDLAAFIADYPEQVYLAGTVQGWCPKCTALSTNLDGPRDRRTQTFTEELRDTLDSNLLWFEYGIDDSITPFTYHFPQADIHEMLSPDLLHQLIKGTFKDHLVTWVCEYIIMEHGEAHGNKILDDIDRRINAAPLFPNLRHFHEGRNFKQWTGKDSKALMKVYLAAIAGHVPDEMVRAVGAFIDVCYIARRSEITESSLKLFDDALAKFYKHREIFRTAGVRPAGFSLPRQHSLSHYHPMMQDFGAPNGVCSSITESRHITAVKKPWRRSNHYNALDQMLLTNQRLDKLHAAKMDFIERGMMPPNSLKPPELPDNVVPRTVYVNNVDEEGIDLDINDGKPFPHKVELVEGNVVLARTRIRGYPRKLDDLAEHIGQPALVELTRRFLQHQISDPSDDADFAQVALDDCPQIKTPISVFHSAVATFYSPSDECGIRGMCRERIRSSPMWRNKGPRHDCALVVEDDDKPGMLGMNVVRVKLFFSFEYNARTYPCALVEWFSRVGRSKDNVTGMWRVRPDRLAGGRRNMDVVHLDSFLRAVHLVPAFGEDFLPLNFDPLYSLDAFAGFFVNQYTDHHIHEVLYQ